MCVFQRLQSTFEGCKVKFCQNPGMVSPCTLRIPRVPLCQLLCPEPAERRAHAPPTPPEPPLPRERLIHVCSRMFSMRPGTHDIMCVYRTAASTITRTHQPINPSPPSVASPPPRPYPTVSYSVRPKCKVQAHECARTSSAEHSQDT